MTGSASAVTFRDAQCRDVAAMFELRARTRENALSPHALAALGITPASIEALLRAGRAVGRVGEHGSVLAGFSLGDPATGEILVLAVGPAFEGRGVGRALLQAVARDLRVAGCRRLWLATSAEPEVRAYGFYRALGWQPTGQRVESGDEILEHLIE